MRDAAISFASKFVDGKNGVVKFAELISAKLTRNWRDTAGGTLPERYSELYRAVDGEIGAVTGQIPNIPCAKGCNHCCKFNRILVSRYEAILLVRHIEGLDAEERSDVVARILSSENESGGPASSPCALLNESCSVYASRPLTCRGYYSTSEPSCRKFMLDRVSAQPNLALTRIVEFAASEVASNWKDSLYEINSLLRRIYSDPIKRSAWISGTPCEESDLAVPGRVVRQVVAESR